MLALVAAEILQINGHAQLLAHVTVHRRRVSDCKIRGRDLSVVSFSDQCHQNFPATQRRKLDYRSQGWSMVTAALTEADTFPCGLHCSSLGSGLLLFSMEWLTEMSNNVSIWRLGGGSKEAKCINIIYCCEPMDCQYEHCFNLFVIIYGSMLWCSPVPVVNFFCSITRSPRWADACLDIRLSTP